MIAIPGALSLVLLLSLALNSVSGLYKLQKLDGGASNLLVAKNQANPEYLYLYQFNRTSATPSQAALNLFIEVLLKLLNVKFHRIANQFFLGSQTHGAAPFIQFEGKYYDGVDNILELLDGKIKKKWPKVDEGKAIKNFALDEMFKILMRDRWTRYDGEKSGLDFMLNDQGIREQMMPAVPWLADATNPQLTTIGGKFIIKKMSREFWKTYFDISKKEGMSDEEKYNAIRGYLEKLEENEWPDFHNAMEAYVETTLKTVFINGATSSEGKLKPLLEQNMLDKKPYSSYSEVQLFNKFLSKLTELKIVEKLEKTKRFLFGKKPSMADAALFGILVQYFETPLNIPEFKSLFTPDKMSEADRKRLAERKEKIVHPMGYKGDEKVKEILKKFMERMKKDHLGLGEGKWNQLTQKPWTLNYEEQKETKTYNGPYQVDPAELVDLDKLDSFLPSKKEGESGETSGDGAGGKGGTTLLKRIVEKVAERAVEKTKKGKEDVEKATGMMLAETVRYLCELSANKCGKYKQSRSMYTWIVAETKKVVYGTIVAINDQEVAERLLAAAKQVFALARAEPTNPAYASELKVGNEF